MLKKDFLSKYDFKKYIMPQLFSNCVSDRCIDYAEKNGDEGFKKFNELFWDNPNKKIIEYKQSSNIKINISFIDILQTFPNEIYYDYLFDYYVNGFSLDDLKQKYMVYDNRSSMLIIPLDPIILDDMFCPECFSNKFNIDMRNENVLFRCCECGVIIKNNMLSQSEAEEAKRLKLIEFSNYMEQINDLKSRINPLPCPMCGDKALHIRNTINKFNEFNSKHKKLNYLIKCRTCNYRSNRIDKVEEAFVEKQKRQEKIAVIKSMELDLINEKLSYKNQDKTCFVIEKLITSDFSDVQLNDFIKTNAELYGTNSYDFTEVLHNTSRIDRKLLAHIINIIGDNAEIIVDKYDYSFYKIVFNSPLVYELIDTTGIIPIRKILKNLMIKHLLFADEENNCIFITEYIRERLNILEDYNDLHNADNLYLKFVTLSRQDYRCYICGESGKQLDLAYLSTNKKTMNLNDVIGLCPDCFRYSTKNGVIIDAFIMSDVFYYDSKCRSVRFLKTNLPDIMEIGWVEQLEKTYGEKDLIKALSISIDAYNNDILSSENDINRYTRGILKNAFTDGVNLRKGLYEKYNMSKWLND